MADNVGACFARLTVLGDGTNRRDTGCLRTDWNPLHCIGGHNTDTNVYECCSDRNYCNDCSLYSECPLLEVPLHGLIECWVFVKTCVNPKHTQTCLPV